MQSVAVYLHVYNCLVIMIEYRLASHAIILKGGAAASETLIGGCIWTIGGYSASPKNSLGRTLSLTKKFFPFALFAVYHCC